MTGAVFDTSPRLGAEEFARLYQQHWRVLWCAAVGVVGDRTLAQDIVQQAAVVALQRLDKFTPDSSFVAWMTQIVKNISLNEGRKRGRRRTGAADPEALDAGALRAGGAQERRAGPPIPGEEPFDDDLVGALSCLDETARGCLLMRVLLEMPYKQIALALDIPEGTAASHVHRARASLRQALRPVRGEQGRPA